MFFASKSLTLQKKLQLPLNFMVYLIHHDYTDACIVLYSKET